MAGTPATHERIALLDTIEADIMEQLATGESLRRIAVRLSDKLKEPISERVLSKWANVSTERAAAFARARSQAADMLADGVLDRSHDLVRDVALGLADKTNVAAVRVANDADQWMAGVWNRDRFGQQSNVAVQVNIGALHLDSLRQTTALPERPALTLDGFVTEMDSLGSTGHSVTLADLL